MEKVLYNEVFEKKIKQYSLENNSIKSVDYSFDEKKSEYNALLHFDDFVIQIVYSCSNWEQYSFMESQTTSRCLLTTFKFPFSDYPFSAYDVHNALQDNKFETLEFHCLYDETALEAAIDAITAFITRNSVMLCEINSSPELQKALNDSYLHDLAVASKRITKTKLESDIEKYTNEHSVNLYFYRKDESVFTDFAVRGKRRALENFFVKKSAKGKFLKYEERFYNYLMESDFKINNEAFVENVKISSKKASRIEIADTIAIIFSLILALILNFSVAELAQNSISDEYIIIKSFAAEPSFTIFLAAFAGFIILTHRLITYLLLRKGNLYKYDIPPSKTAMTVWICIALTIITASTTIIYFDNQRCIALGENDIYFSDELREVEKIPYDNVKFYVIDGWYGDEYYDENCYKTVVTVINNDYKNCYESKNFYDDEEITFDDVVKAIEKHSKIPEHYKDYDSFAKANCSYNK